MPYPGPNPYPGPRFKPIHERSAICKHCGRKGSEHDVAAELRCPELSNAALEGAKTP